MIERAFFYSSALLFFLSGQVFAEAGKVTQPITQGMAKLVVERSNQSILSLQEALISLNGRPAGTLAGGGKLQVDLPAGTWRLSVQARPTAEHAVLVVNLGAGKESVVRVELDPVRFPPQGNASGLGYLIRQSLDAPHDDRQPLFRLRQIVSDATEGER